MWCDTGMDFDSFVLVRLVRPADAVRLPPDEAARTQDAHLAHLHDLYANGELIAAGPSMGGDERVRGFAIMTIGLDEARQRWAEDPAVRAGVFVAELEPWSVPAAMIVAGAGVPPRSSAEASS